jgi:hypothetical protein
MTISATAQTSVVGRFMAAAGMVAVVIVTSI